MAGLLDLPKSGRPPLADEAKVKLVWQSRAAGKTVYEIARLTNLSARTINRLLARFGLLEDAEPVFATGQNLPWVGAFLGLALLEKDLLLGVARQVLGGRLGRALYGLRTVRMREIRVIRDDGGQTSVLVGNTQASAVEVCALLFGRWAAQENGCKYLRAEHDLGATVEYGDEPLSEGIAHPNPESVKRRKALAGWVAKRDRLLAKLGVRLTEEALSAATLAKRLARGKSRASAARV